MASLGGELPWPSQFTNANCHGHGKSAGGACHGHGKPSGDFPWLALWCGGVGGGGEVALLGGWGGWWEESWRVVWWASGVVVVGLGVGD